MGRDEVGNMYPKMRYHAETRPTAFIAGATGNIARCSMTGSFLGLEASCRAIAEEPADEIRNALATNLSDLLRYQNMLCRYDAMALKSLDVFSVHGFPVGLQCESNILGIVNGGKGLSVGSGGWSNMIDKYARAKAYCQDVFEVKHQGNRKTFVHIKEEWIGEAGRVNGRTGKRNVELHCGSATVCELPHGSIDAV